MRLNTVPGRSLKQLFKVCSIMKVLHVVPSFYPAYIYGGPIESVYQLCRHTVKEGCEVRVLTTDANGPHDVLDIEKDHEVAVDNLRVRYCRRSLRHRASPELLRRLPTYVRWADIVHLTAVYSFPTIPTLTLCRLMNKPIVWSPRGGLQRWSGSTRRSLKAAWERVCRAVSPKKLLLHVTSEAEAQESRQRIPGVDTVIIPNGIEMPEKIAHRADHETLRLLYLGRLHPIKGLENLLDACKALNDSSCLAWSLTIAGSGDPHYTTAIRGRIEALGLSRQAKMVGSVAGKAKAHLFECADVLVMPSHKENFGMVAAEALAHGVAVLACKGTPWQRIDTLGCGRWVDNDPMSMAEAIEQMSRMPLRKMGMIGREWVAQQFSWDRQTREMVGAYKAMVKSGESQQVASWIA